MHIHKRTGAHVHTYRTGWWRLSSSLFRATVDYLTQLSVVPSWSNDDALSLRSPPPCWFHSPLFLLGRIDSRYARSTGWLLPRTEWKAVGGEKKKKKRKRALHGWPFLRRWFFCREFTSSQADRLTVKGITETVSSPRLPRSSIVKAFRCSSWDVPTLLIIVSRVITSLRRWKISRRNYRRLGEIAPLSILVLLYQQIDIDIRIPSRSFSETT